MIVVTGWLRVEPHERDRYLAGCHAVIVSARDTPGCLDFHLSADPLEEDRVNVLELWESTDALEAFRGSGPDDEQAAMIVAADVQQYDIEP